MQLPRQNPAYLGILQYAQISIMVNMNDKWSTPLLDAFGVVYKGAFLHVIAGYSFPLGTHLGVQANLFSHSSYENFRTPITEHDEIRVGHRDRGAQLSFGWAAADWASIGIGASVFSMDAEFETRGSGITIPPNEEYIRTAYCFGVLLKNHDSTGIFDILS